MPSSPSPCDQRYRLESTMRWSDSLRLWPIGRPSCGCDNLPLTRRRKGLPSSCLHIQKGNWCDNLLSGC